MLRPPPLKRGDVVRVVAPSGPFDPRAFEDGLEVLRSRLGLVPRMRPDVTARTHVQDRQQDPSTTGRAIAAKAGASPSLALGEAFWASTLSER